ncbi:hypothetical protein BDF22DRAFT_746512 [Syncephalis plumigaleata]|nr:hypothetical protein BDF22DRAFT_746512 [Syncephalis plumigaleata]
MSDLALQDPFWQAPQCPSKLSLAFLVSRIYTAEINLTVQSLIELQQHLNAPVLTDTLLRELDSLLEAITYRLERATPCFFTAEKGEGMTPEAIAKAQLFDHLLALCLIIFGKEETAQAISEEPWRRLLECVTHLVVEEDIRPYNILVNRMLRLSDRNLTFRVLLTLLERSALELSPYDALDSPAVKFVGLVMRYIWRRTKSIAEDECHLFVAASPPAIWVRRTDEQYPLTNQPLRTVKTILHELVGVLGPRTSARRGTRTAAASASAASAATVTVTSSASSNRTDDTTIAPTTITMIATKKEQTTSSGQDKDGVSLTIRSNVEGETPAASNITDANEPSIPVITTTAALAVASGMTAAVDIISMPNEESGDMEHLDNGTGSIAVTANKHDTSRMEFNLINKSNRPVLHARPPSARRSTLTSKQDIFHTSAVHPSHLNTSLLCEAAPPTPFMTTITAPAMQTSRPYSKFHSDPDLGIKLTSTFAKLFIAGERQEGIKALSKLRKEYPITDEFIRCQLARSTPAFKEEILDYFKRHLMMLLIQSRQHQ